MATKFLSQKMIFFWHVFTFYLNMGFSVICFAYFFEEVFKITVSPPLGVRIDFFQNRDRCHESNLNTYISGLSGKQFGGHRSAKNSDGKA